MSAQSAALALLAQVTNSEPSGAWSAPGRVNLIGEHTDYNEGFVLPLAIDRRTHVAVAPRNDGILRVASTVAPRPVDVPITDVETIFAPSRNANALPAWANYPVGVVWAAMRAAGIYPSAASGLNLAFASDVPVGAGLSSSAAIECATAIALNDLWSLGLGPEELAEVGHRAENEAVGAPTGIMDQLASMLGEKDSAIFLDCRSLTARAVPLGFAAAGLELLVIDTRVSHDHATGGYDDRRAACERGAARVGVRSLRELDESDLESVNRILDDVTFRRVRHIVTENRRVLDAVDILDSTGPRAIGDLLVASHRSMRDDFEISVAELDLAVDEALAAGAIGARMTGGGFGGSAIAIVDRADIERVIAGVTTAFAASGYREPCIFTATASRAACRDW